MCTQVALTDRWQNELILRTFRGQFWWIEGMRWEGWEWTECNTGGGEGIKRVQEWRSPHPLPTCKPAGGRRGGENLAGGAWRGLEECWGRWENFWVSLFQFHSSSLFLFTCEPGIGGLAHVPVFGRVEREEIFEWKWKFYRLNRLLVVFYCQCLIRSYRRKYSYE